MITTNTEFRKNGAVHFTPAQEAKSMIIDGVTFTFSAGRFFLFEKAIQNDVNRLPDDVIDVVETDEAFIITTVKEMTIMNLENPKTKTLDEVSTRGYENTPLIDCPVEVRDKFLEGIAKKLGDIFRTDKPEPEYSLGFKRYEKLTKKQRFALGYKCYKWEANLIDLLQIYTASQLMEMTEKPVIETKEVETTEVEPEAKEEAAAPEVPEVVGFTVGHTYIGQFDNDIEVELFCKDIEVDTITFAYEGKEWKTTKYPVPNKNYEYARFTHSYEYCDEYYIENMVHIWSNKVLLDDLESERIEICNEIRTNEDWWETRDERIRLTHQEYQQLRTNRAAAAKEKAAKEKAAKEKAPVKPVKKGKKQKSPTFPSKKFPKYREQEFWEIVALLDGCGVKIENITAQWKEDLHNWKLTDSEGNAAGLWLSSWNGWDCEPLGFKKPLKGFFEGIDFPDFLEMNGIKTIETED